MRRDKLEVIPIAAPVDPIFTDEGGLPRGAIIELAGPDGSGKTTFGYIATAAGQKQGLKVGWIAVEKFVKPHAQFFGVDLIKLALFYPDNAEGAFKQVIDWAQEGYDLIIMDSVASLQPQIILDTEDEQLENDEFGDANQYAPMAGYLARTLPRIEKEVTKANTCLLVINQLRANITRGFAKGPADKAWGGNALKHYTSIRMEIRRVSWLKYAGKVVGFRAKLRCPHKNRYTTPQQDALLDIIFDHKAPSLEEMNRRKKNKIGGSIEVEEIKEGGV